MDYHFDTQMQPCQMASKSLELHTLQSAGHFGSVLRLVLLPLRSTVLLIGTFIRAVPHTTTK